MLVLLNFLIVIFCISDLIVIGVMDVVRFEYKLRVLEDLLVIGYDDI